MHIVTEADSDLIKIISFGAWAISAVTVFPNGPAIMHHARRLAFIVPRTQLRCFNTLLRLDLRLR